MNRKEMSELQAPDVNALVSKAFGYQSPHSYFDDFPVWASAQAVRLGLFDQEKLVSHVAYRTAEIRTSTGNEKVAIIGGVATDEAFRGQGLSTQLLKESLRRIEASGCTWSFLWGSEHAFYRKLGFELAGTQARAPLEKLSFSPKELLGGSVQMGMSDKIFKALQSTPKGIVLKAEDQKWVYQHKTVQWFSVDQPFAFVGFERGMDLQHIIHEFGGDPQSLAKILFHVYREDPKAEIMGTKEDLLKTGFDKTDLIEEYLCLARPTLKQNAWKNDFWISGVSAG